MTSRKSIYLTICASIPAFVCGHSLACGEGLGQGDERVRVEAHWLRVPHGSFNEILDDKRAAEARQGTVVSRELSASLINAASADATGKCFRLRAVKLGVGERVTFDPYHVSEDPRHRWSGFTTDDTYLGIERAPDENGSVALIAKVGVMNRPKQKIVADALGLPPDMALVLRGFDANGDEEGKLMDVLLVRATPTPAPPDERKAAPGLPYHITHRDGTLVRGVCFSIAEVLEICGEPPETVIAEGRRQPPRITLATPSWGIGITKKCDDGDVKQIAQASKLRILRVDGCQITDAGLATLTDQPELADLQIVTTGKLTDEGVALLAQLPSLNYLKLQNAELHGETLHRFGALPTLRCLHLFACELHGDALGELGASETLEIVNLNGSTSGVAGIRGLGKMKNLVSLDLSGVRIQSMPEPRPLVDGDLKALGELRSLASLRIQSTHISMQGLAHLADIPKLWIDHHHSRVSDIDAKLMADRLGWTFQGDCNCGCLDIQPNR